MLTCRENKTVADIVSGRMRRRKMLVAIFMIVLFLVNLAGSIYMKQRILGVLGTSFQRSGSALAGMKTGTPQEASLKSMLISSDKELRELMTAAIFRDINWRIFLFGSILFMFIVSLWACGHLERIIKKLEEEKQGKGS
jgi:Na+/H+ antiporter NhaD/arsenite permease-like protein